MDFSRYRRFFTNSVTYKTCIFWKIHNSKRLCPEILKFSMKASLVEAFIRAKLQVEIRKYYFPEKPRSYRDKCTKNSISRREQANGMNPCRNFIYTMSPTYEQNMSSNGVYQLVRFSRQNGFRRQMVYESKGILKSIGFIALKFKGKGFWFYG